MIHTVVIGCSTFPGAEPTSGDLAIDGGLIAAVGKVDGRGRQEIDAQGLAVTPVA